MNKNRILFHDFSLMRFDWCRFDTESGDVKYGHAEVEQLGRIFDPGTSVIVFIPQQLLLLTSAQLPPRASKQQLNAISYAIEDQLAEDIEECFFAVYPQQDDGGVPVAVINQQLMDAVVGKLAEYHISARLILPQVYLCPWDDDPSVIASVCSWRNGFLVRDGLHSGLYCESAVLSQVLQLISQQSSETEQKIVVYGDISWPPDKSDVEVVSRPARELITQDIEETGCINLKQKQYQSSHQWFNVLRLWKWPAAAMALLLLIVLASGFIGMWEQQQSLDRLIQQQNALLKQYLPDLADSSHPKDDLVRYLAENRSGGVEQGFLQQLHEFVRLKEGLNALKTGKMVYQKSNLVVDLESSDLKSLEALRSKLNQSSFSAKIENVNISPEKTTGRLILEGQL